MINKIYDKFSNRVPKPEGRYRSFGVLLPLIYVDNELRVLFEVRSQNLKTQPGEICFPGGAVEKNETPLIGAIRETCEELNITEENIELIGSLDYIVTPFNLILHPYVGILKNIDIKDINYSRDEVDSIFTVPLSDIMNTDFENYFYDTTINMNSQFPFDRILNGKEYNFRTGKYPVCFYYYKDKMIWGMTARILNNFKKLI